MTSQLAFQFIFKHFPCLKETLGTIHHHYLEGDFSLLEYNIKQWWEIWEIVGKQFIIHFFLTHVVHKFFIFYVMAKFKHFWNVSTRNMLKNDIANKVKWDHSSIFGWKYPWVVLLGTTSRNEKGTKNNQIIFMGPLL
jgi:hypothetical protein